MANTYTQIHIQIVFAVRHRQCLIKAEWKDDLYKYITGIVQNNGHKMLAINGMPDHIHILIGIRPVQSISELTQQVKQDSTKWINKQGFVDRKFSWQSGFGAFSYSQRDVPKIINYIKNQENHHNKTSFQDEYYDLLKEYYVDYDQRYVFKILE